MKINDTRHINQVVTRNELKQGEVYIDEFGNYVLRTDGVYLVDLPNGEMHDLVKYYSELSEFIPVNAVLEIR